MRRLDSAFRAYLCVEPWDLLHAGIDNVLDLAQGELGVDGVHSTIVCGPMHQFRGRPDISPRTYRCDDGVFFQPDKTQYGDTRLKPVPIDWIKTRDPLRQIAEACEKRGLLLRVGAHPLSAPSLAARYPFAARKDAYGDISPARLCPANSDVLAYVAALLADLTSRCKVDAIDLADADFGAADSVFLGRDVPALDYWRITCTCFCESCRQGAQAAGVDAGRLAAALQSSDDSSALDALATDLSRYTEVQRVCVRRLWQEASNACKANLWLEMASHTDERRAFVEDIPQTVCGVLIPRFDEADEGPKRDAIPPHLQLGVRHDLRVQAKGGNSSDILVSRVSHDVRNGCSVAIFDGYGLMMPERLAWVRRAIRFARRGS